MSEFRPDPGRAASFGRGRGGILELIPGRGVFFLGLHEKERKKERKKGVDIEKDKKKEKKKSRRKHTPHMVGRHTHTKVDFSRKQKNHIVTSPPPRA